MKGKILLLTENFPPIEGGSGRWFWELYSRLDPANVLVVTHDEADSKAVDDAFPGQVIRMPLRSTEWGLKSWVGLGFYWRCVRALRKLIKQHNVTEVHCGRVIHEGVTAWLATRLGAFRYRCFIHGEDVETAATSREQALLVKQVCRHAETLICNSENSKGLTQSLGFNDGDKCVVLHPGADVDRFVCADPDTDFRQTMGWDDRFVVLTVGRLQRRKGQDYFIQALPQIVQAIPNCLYVVIGSGELQATLSALASEQGMENHVQFLSGLNDETLIACYQQCDWFVLPNRTIGNDIEGFGMVLVEAQACGKPVIAGDSGGTRETMDSGNIGFIVDCSSPQAIADNVTPLLLQPRKAPSVYRDHALQHFTWERHVEKFSALIE